MSVLEVKNLTHAYNDLQTFVNNAVKDVNFSVEKGEIIGIIGHTGSGKTTLVQHLNGLLKPTSGNILLENEDIWANPKEIRKIRSKIGLVFQYPEYQLFEETVFADIAYGPKNMGLKGDELNNRVIETCELIGITPDFYEKSPFDLSGGEKRRVAIAGVMSMKPQVIVFDEPIAGLDPRGRENVMEIIKKYRDYHNATVIIISHSMEDMVELCDKVLVMNKGEAVMFDTPYNVFSKGDELRKIGLDVPFVTKVFDLLRKKGIAVPGNIFTLDEALKAILKLKEGKNA